MRTTTTTDDEGVGDPGCAIDKESRRTSGEPENRESRAKELSSRMSERVSMRG
jgi:hypothetical protein